MNKVKVPTVIIFLVIATSFFVTAEEPNYSKISEDIYQNIELPSASGTDSKGTYDARVIVYIVEPVAERWLMYDSTPFHYALLDFALDTIIELHQDESFNASLFWDASTTPYSDVTEDNIMAIAAVFHLDPQQAYGNPPATNPFIGYFTDAVAAADPFNSWPHSSSGSFTHNVLGEKITASW